MRNKPTWMKIVATLGMLVLLDYDLGAIIELSDFAQGMQF